VRTLLVALLVAVPVMAMVMASAFVRTDPPHLEARFGRADIVVSRYVADRREADLTPPIDATAVVPRARAARVLRGTQYLQTKSGTRLNTQVMAGDVDAAPARGVIHVLKGRLPRTGGEVALSPSAARRLRAGIGDVVDLRRPAAKLRVVGSAVAPEEFTATLFVLHGFSPAAPIFVFSDEVFIDLPGRAGVAAVKRAVDSLGAAEAAVDLGASPARLIRSVGYRTPPVAGEQPFGSDDDDAQVAANWTYVGGSLLLLVTGIVIAAAFAVGARRQLRTLGMLAANGAERGALRGVLLCEGAFCGVLGVVLGFAMGAAGLALLAPHRNRLLGQIAESWTVRPVDLVPIALLGIAAAVLAATQPARSATRLSVLQSLAGQRPVSAVPRWLVPLGLASFAAGLGMLAFAVAGADDADGSTTGLTLTAIAGGVSVVLGMTATAPAAVARLEPLAARLRGTWRVTARSLARQRSRTSGVVAAIAATAALAIVASAGTLSATSEVPGDEVQVRDVVAVRGVTTFDENDAVARDAPEAAVVQAAANTVHAKERAVANSLSVVAAPSGLTVGPFTTPQNAAIGTAELVAFLGAGDAAATALAQGQPVLIRPGAKLHTAPLALVSSGHPGDRSLAPRVDTTVVVVDGAYDPFVLPDLLVPASVADQLGVAPDADEVLLRAPQPLSGEQRSQLRLIDDESVDRALDDTRLNSFPIGGVRFREVASGTGSLLAQAGLVAGALLFTLLVVAIALGLAAAEGKAERDVLVAVGARPRALVGIAGSKALVMALVGAVLAIPTALVPVWVWTRASVPDRRFVIPWLVIALLVLAVPAIAGGLTTLASAVGARLHPARASAFSAD